ncbi:MAG: carbohydrate-binding domain-containing protein [Prevotella sp.]
MRRLSAFIILCVFMAQALMAQQALRIQRTDGVTDYAPVSMIDEITFSKDLSQFTIVAGVVSVTIDCARVVDMGYAEAPASLSVRYDGASAMVDNPYLLQGVSAAVSGAAVAVTNSNVETELTFELAGATACGSFLYKADYKTTIVLNGVTITNPSGPAIDIECGKRIAMELKKGTVNTLTDGSGGDWKAALYCKGHLEIDKSGTLNVTGNTKHAISAKEYIQLKKSDGTINVLAAVSDGIHCGQYFLANGYTVNIHDVGGDGIQAELCGDEDYDEDYADGSLWIQGGVFGITCSGEDVSGLKADTDININDTKSVPAITITMTGNGSKGMKADGNVNIGAGDITISNSGATFDDGTEEQSAKCISSDTSVNIINGNLRLTATGAGGKCIKSDGTIVIGEQETKEGPQIVASTTGGTATTPASSTSLTTRAGGGWGGGAGGGPGGGNFPGGQDNSESSAKAIKAMGAINIYGGEVTVATASSGAEGIESKTSINISGGHHYLRCYDDAINSDGPIVFGGGVTVCCSTGNDAVDSNYGKAGAIVIGDGVVLAYSTSGGAEMGFDCDSNSYIQIKGSGTAISLGGSQGGSSSATLATASQGYAFVTSSVSFQAGRYYTLADSTGKNLVTFSLDGNVSSKCTMLTASGMQKGGTYTLRYGSDEPSDAQTSFHGLYLGSTMTGTTSVTSFTAK